MPGKINPKYSTDLIRKILIGPGVPEPGSEASKRLAELKNKKNAKKNKKPAEKSKKRFGGAVGPNGIL